MTQPLSPLLARRISSLIPALPRRTYRLVLRVGPGVRTGSTAAALSEPLPATTLSTRFDALQTESRTASAHVVSCGRGTPRWHTRREVHGVRAGRVVHRRVGPVDRVILPMMRMIVLLFVVAPVVVEEPSNVSSVHLIQLLTGGLVLLLMHMRFGSAFLAQLLRHSRLQTVSHAGATSQRDLRLTTGRPLRDGMDGGYRSEGR